MMKSTEPQLAEGGNGFAADTDPSIAVPKSMRGIVPGGSLPGALNIRVRARGEVPSWGQQRLDEDEEEQDKSQLDMDLPTTPTPPTDEDQYGEIAFDAELAGNADDAQDEVLVIDGVKTSNHGHCSRNRRIAFLVVFVALACGAGYKAWNDTTRVVNRHAGSNEQQGASPSNTTAPAPGTTAAEPRGGNLNWTIAAALISFHDGGSLSLVIRESSGLFLQVVNDTDKNFTLFDIGNEASFLEGVDLSLVSKMIQPSWAGHVLNILEGYVVEDQVLAVEDMHDGMVLTSVSGYPLTIHLDPLRVNNVTVSTIQRNFYSRNGVIHTITRYPNPLMPWARKSTYKVLLETNSLRRGDLSNFIALLDASPDLKIQLEQGQGNGATTLFVPTNEALATSDLTFLANATATQFFLEHHFVIGNFARRSWRAIIPTANQVSDTALRLETQAGPMLELEIDNDVVTINGTATIVQQDLFTIYGVMHVIDQPLMTSTAAIIGW